MGRSAGGLILKGIGLLLLAFLALTVVGIVVSVVSTIISILVSLVVLAAVLLAVFGLVSLLGGGGGSEPQDSRSAGRTARRVDDRDPAARLRERYVAGEIDESEFERRLEEQLGPSESRAGSRRDRDRSRDRLLDR